VAEREYEVWSTYKVTGVGHVRAHSVAEAIEKALELGGDEPVIFDFSEPWGETRMQARRTPKRPNLPHHPARPRAPARAQREEVMSETESYTRIEYGVIVDRTKDGLGYYLAHASESLPTAEMHADLQPEKYPVEIKTRLVTRTAWQPLHLAGEHVPECNDRCDGDEHYLLPTAPTTRPAL
jgi:hypothetical protein